MFIEIFSSLISMFLELSLSFQEEDFSINSIRLRVFSLEVFKAFESLLLSLDIESETSLILRLISAGLLVLVLLPWCRLRTDILTIVI